MEKKRNLEIDHPRINEVEFDSPHPTIDDNEKVKNNVNDAAYENQYVNEQ